VEHSPVPLDSIALMINLDMVGRLENGPLIVELTSHATRFRRAVDSLAAEAGISIRYSRITASRSDHSSFAAHGIPAIAVFTGYHRDYHRRSDTPDKIDFTGLLRIVDLVEAVVRTTGTQPINGR
jgi:Zn-dependent M28 family amino/carboxypeptidase